MIKSLKLAFIGIALIAGAGVAHAADCQLRNIQFVGIHPDGRLMINAEMWDLATNTKVGTLGNATFCRVNTTFGTISSETCRAWQATATAAMLAGKKIYLNQTSCQTGNGVTVTTNMLG